MDISKIASLFIMFGLSTVCGSLSILMVRCLMKKFGTSGKLNRAVSWLDCFSGGVFFAATILDLLPEARESMEHALEHYTFQTEYPLTELLLCIGFFFMLVIEHFSQMCCSPRKVVPAPDTRARRQQHPEELVTDVHGKTSEIIVICDSCIDSSVSQTYVTIDKAGSGQLSPKTAYPTDKFANKNNSSKSKVRDICQTPGNGNDEPLNTNAVRNNAMETGTGDMKRSKIRGAVLLIALSLHMIFDGLALGLLTENSDVWQLLGAISLHKCLVFFTIGLQSVEILASAKKAVCVVIFLAIISPLGVLIGEAINSSDDVIARDTVSAILQGIATGTFLFVTFFEIMLRELGSHNSNLPKIIFSFFGFVLMALVRLLAHEDHH